MRCLGTATALSSHTLKEGSLRCAEHIIKNPFEASMSGIRSNCEDGYGDATLDMTRNTTWCLTVRYDAKSRFMPYPVPIPVRYHGRVERISHARYRIAVSS